MDQTRLMAKARHSFRTNSRTLPRPGPSQPTSRRQLTSVRTLIPATAPIALPEPTIVVEADASPRAPLLATWCAFGLWAAMTAIEQHAVLAQHLLRSPAVEIAMRGQLAVGAFLVAAATPRKPHTPRLH
jgi:hypothetical protein